MARLDSSLAGPAEPEPDMEFDLTLASCCQREIRDRRIKQGMLDAVRAGMPAAVFPAPRRARARKRPRPARACPQVSARRRAHRIRRCCPARPGGRAHACQARQARLCARPGRGARRRPGKRADGALPGQGWVPHCLQLVRKPLCERPNTIPSPWRPVLRSWWTSRSSWLSTQVDWSHFPSTPVC